MKKFRKVKSMRTVSSFTVAEHGTCTNWCLTISRVELKIPPTDIFVVSNSFRKKKDGGTRLEFFSASILLLIKNFFGNKKNENLESMGKYRGICAAPKRTLVIP